MLRDFSAWRCLESALYLIAEQLHTLRLKFSLHVEGFNIVPDDAHLRGLGERGVLGAAGGRPARRLPEAGDAQRGGLRRRARGGRRDTPLRRHVAHQGDPLRAAHGEEEGAAGGEGHHPTEKGRVFHY